MSDLEIMEKAFNVLQRVIADDKRYVTESEEVLKLLKQRVYKYKPPEESSVSHLNSYLGGLL